MWIILIGTRITITTSPDTATRSTEAEETTATIPKNTGTTTTTWKTTMWLNKTGTPKNNPTQLVTTTTTTAWIGIGTITNRRN